jgi:hypothetical protein
MSQDLLHFVMSGGLIAVGIYLLGHPRVLSSRTRLVRAVVIWLGLVLGLRAIDYLFLS